MVMVNLAYFRGHMGFVLGLRVRVATTTVAQHPQVVVYLLHICPESGSQTRSHQSYLGFQGSIHRCPQKLPNVLNQTSCGIPLSSRQALLAAKRVFEISIPQKGVGGCHGGACPHIAPQLVPSL